MIEHWSSKALHERVCLKVLVSSVMNCWSCSWESYVPNRGQDQTEAKKVAVVGSLEVVNNVQAQDNARARKCSEDAADESDKRKARQHLIVVTR